MSRCPKSDAAANAGDMDNQYKVSADFEMKLTAAHAEIAELRALVAQRTISLDDALVEPVGRVMAWEAIKHHARTPDLAWDALSEKYTRLAREALRSIGVPLKKS